MNHKLCLRPWTTEHAVTQHNLREGDRNAWENARDEYEYNHRHLAPYPRMCMTAVTVRPAIRQGTGLPKCDWQKECPWVVEVRGYSAEKLRDVMYSSKHYKWLCMLAKAELARRDQ